MKLKTFRMELLCFLILCQIYQVSAEIIFHGVEEGQSIELPYAVPHHGTPFGLHLYHQSVHSSQTTVLSLDEDGTPRISPKHSGRLRLSGGLKSVKINVTLLHLEDADTGLYIWEMVKKNSSEHIISDQKLFLVVKAAEKVFQCSSVYPPLLFTISAAAGLILVIICWITMDYCVKFRHHHKCQPSAPVYVEMTRKQQTTGVAQNIPETPSHLEEAPFPVYANPSFRQPQDNYYACPRQLGLKAA